MIGRCENPDYNCKYRRTIGHHLYHPKRDYQTELENAFRNLGCNIVQMCECAEKQLHEFTNPPSKPSVEEMVVALTVKFEGVGDEGLNLRY